MRPEDRYEKRRYAAVLILRELAQVLARGQEQPLQRSAKRALPR